MTTGTATPHRSEVTAEHENFWHLVHAEWTKFRTVRGWVIAVIATIAAITGFVFVATSVSRSCVTSGAGSTSGSGSTPGAASASACPPSPTGPGGEPVQDAFYFLHQPLTGNGTITVQLTSLTGQVAIGPGSNGQPRWDPACSRDPRPGSSSRKTRRRAPPTRR